MLSITRSFVSFFNRKIFPDPIFFMDYVSISTNKLNLDIDEKFALRRHIVTYLIHESKYLPLATVMSMTDSIIATWLHDFGHIEETYTVQSKMTTLLSELPDEIMRKIYKYAIDLPTAIANHFVHHDRFGLYTYHSFQLANYKELNRVILRMLTSDHIRLIHLGDPVLDFDYEFLRNRYENDLKEMQYTLPSYHQLQFYTQTGPFRLPLNFLIKMIRTKNLCHFPTLVTACSDVIDLEDLHAQDRDVLHSGLVNEHLNKDEDMMNRTSYTIQSEPNFLADMHPDAAYIFDLIEDLWLVYENLMSVSESRRVRGTISALLSFVKHRTKTSLINTMTKDVTNYVSSVFSGYEVQSLTSIKQGLDFSETFFDSPLFEKLNKCLMFGLTYSLFDKMGIDFSTCGYSMLEASMIRKRFSNKMEFTRAVISTVVFLFERGIQIYKTGDINTIFHSPSVYADIYDATKKLKTQSGQLNDPESHGFTESQFRADLDAVIEKLVSIKKHCHILKNADKKILLLLHDEMFLLRDDLNTKAQARKNRKAPFGLLLFGDSGIGKTTLTEHLFQYTCKVLSLPNGSEFKYTRNPKAKFWDGFTTSCHTIILDDIAAELPDAVSNSCSVDEILQVMNNAAFCPDQAHLEDKGKTPMRAKMVIGTTNVKNLNSFAYYTCPSAVQRRFPFIITPTVRPEYLNSRGMLDSLKVDSDCAFPNLWTYKVEMVVPTKIDSSKTKQSMAKMELVGDNMEQKEFYIWLRDSILRFFEDQDRVEKNSICTQESEVCKCCQLPQRMCDFTIQSLTMHHFTHLAFITLFMGKILHYLTHNRFFETIQFFITLMINAVKFRDFAFAKAVTAYTVVHAQVTKERMIKIGEKMQFTISPIKIMSFILLIAACKKLNDFFSTIESEDTYTVQGVSNQIGKVPMKELDGRENVWYNNEVELTSADLSRQSLSAKSMPFTKFLDVVSKNVVSIKTASGTWYKHGKATCIGGQIYVTNCHVMPEFGQSTTIDVISMSAKTGVNSNWSGVICETDILRFKDLDLCFFVLRNIPPKKNIYKFITNNHGGGTFNGAYVRRGEDGHVQFKDLKKIKYVSSLPLEINKVTQNSPRYTAFHHEKLVDGDCGCPMVVQTGVGYMIAGIHVASANESMGVVATTIDFDVVDKALKHFSDFTVQSGCFDMISAPGYERALTGLHKKSPIRYMDEGSAHVYGSFTGHRGKNKSTVRHTPMSYILSNHGYQIKFAKPEMQTWHPWHIGLTDMVKPLNTLRGDILDECADAYIQDILNSVDGNQVKEMVHILDNFTAINGAEVAYIDKINRNTSAGLPWKKKKKFFMEAAPPQFGMQDPVKVDAQIMDRVDKIIETYREHTQAHPNYCAHLKDEPVSFKKARNGKTRVFTGAPFDMTIVMRKFLLGVTRLLQNNRIAFESAPGTVAQSLEWEELRNHVTKYGLDRMLAGDYEHFDKDLAAIEIKGAFKVLKALCKESGNYTEDDLKIIDCICADTCFALVDYNGDLLQLFGSNPSGNPLTVIINCIVNCIRMRYMYYILNPDKECRSFQANVALMTYGDDNICSVSKKCDFFNHTSLQKAFADHGIVYTMAEKEKESVPFIHIDEATFLKRKWVFNTELDAFLAPLDHESIEKSLMVWKRSKVICEESQVIQVIGNALVEYFFYGRDVFEEKTALLKHVVSELDLELYVEDNTFPTFDSLVDNFRRSSKRSPLYKIKGWHKVFDSTT